MKYSKFIPALVWMVVIFYFSSRQTTGIGTDATDRFLILKSFHLIEYATLAILLFYRFLRYKPVVLVAYLYAISDEIHQYFVPGRTSKFTDTLIDLLGILIGLLVIRTLMLKYPKVR